MFRNRLHANILSRLTHLTTDLEGISERLSRMEQRDLAKSSARGGALLKYMGVSPDRFMKRYFEDVPENAYYEALFGGSESLRGRPEVIGLKSGVCRQLQFSLDEFRFWMNAMNRSGPTP